MRSRRRLVIVFILAVITVAATGACDGRAQRPGAGGPQPLITPPPGPVVIDTRNVAGLGSILVDARGYTLYIFPTDTDHSTGAAMRAWAAASPLAAAAWCQEQAESFGQRTADFVEIALVDRDDDSRPQGGGRSRQRAHPASLRRHRPSQGRANCRGGREPPAPRPGRSSNHDLLNCFGRPVLERFAPPAENKSIRPRQPACGQLSPVSTTGSGHQSRPRAARH